MINDEDTQIPESTREIVKMLETLLSKPKSNLKIKTWLQEFETLVEDIKNHKQSKTLTKLQKKVESVLRLLSSKNEVPKSKNKTKKRQ